MHTAHNILVRKHLNMSFPVKVKLLKVSGMMYCLIFYLFQSLYLFVCGFYFEKTCHNRRGEANTQKAPLLYFQNCPALFIEPEGHQV